MNKIFKYILITAILTATVGITLTIIGLSFGGKLSDVYRNNCDSDSEYRFPKSTTPKGGVENSVPNVDNIHSIDFELDGMLAQIVYGDGYSVSTAEDNMITQQNDMGEWKIKTVRYPGLNDYKKRSITITIPKDLNLKEISLSINGGALTAEELIADKIDIDGNAADIVINNLQCKTLETDLAVGLIEINGEVTKKVESDCDIGEIILNLKRPNKYRYEIEVSVGTINIDDEIIPGINSHIKGGADAMENDAVFYNLECDVGSINVNHQ